MTYEFRGVTLPPDTQLAIDRFVEHGFVSSQWLIAVLSNKFNEAALQADEENAAALVAIAGYLHWEVPADCWGSLDKVDAWAKRKSQERTAVCGRGE